MLIGTSWRFSSRFCAVTTISSWSLWAALAGGGGGGGGAGWAAGGPVSDGGGRGAGGERERRGEAGRAKREGRRPIDLIHSPERGRRGARVTPAGPPRQFILA